MVDHAEDSSCPLPIYFIVSYLIFYKALFDMSSSITKIYLSTIRFIYNGKKIPFNINVDSDFSTPKLAKCIMTGIKIAVHNQREEILT